MSKASLFGLKFTFGVLVGVLLFVLSLVTLPVAILGSKLLSLVQRQTATKTVPAPATAAN